MKWSCCTGNSSTSTTRTVIRKTPIIITKVNGISVRTLVDSGCTTSMIRRKRAKGESMGKRVTKVMAFDGSVIECSEEEVMTVNYNNINIRLKIIATENLLSGVDFILGMDGIEEMGGVSIKNNKVKFGKEEEHCVMVIEKKPVLKIKDRDFEARFDGEKWLVRWKWKNEIPELKNRVKHYRCMENEKIKKGAEEEIERWICEGILTKVKSREKGFLPLMAIEQPTKNKIRPVIDFRELNSYIECNTGDEVDVCDETLRKWRKKSRKLKLVDLKSAYLQLHVEEDLRKFQLVSFKGETYQLTRVGFGLNSAPRIMCKILKEVLSRDEEIRRGTSSYIDDIIVDEEIVTAEKVIEHLKKFGLSTKEPEDIKNGRILGLSVEQDKTGKLSFKRGNEIVGETEKMTRRELFSLCGKLVGHYPIAGWLRTSCSFIKRISEGVGWEDYIGDRARSYIEEVIRLVKEDDPVRGRWDVGNSQRGRIWCDSSSLALGVVLEIEGEVVEDASWMRSEGDVGHINVSELEAVLKGINLAIKWGLKEVEILTDSRTVENWLKLTITKRSRIRTKGSAEMLIKRRLGIFSELIKEFGLNVDVNYVQSERNKADVLTRVKRAWLKDEVKQHTDKQKKEDEYKEIATRIKEVHEKNHFGVERTLFLARKSIYGVERSMVERCVKNCVRCQSIDPAPIRHEGGALEVLKNWRRLAMDVTHVMGKPYLSIVDCGPSRYAIWKELNRENAESISKELEELFCERGPVKEILTDNGTVFKSEKFKSLCEEWGVKIEYRAAYRPAGNGIAERMHRTIKRTIERSRISPIRAVYFYNITPKEGQKENTVPMRGIFAYEDEENDERAKKEQDEENVHYKFRTGEEVWVKPGIGNCTDHWRKKKITRILSKNKVEVDGMARHVLDVRKVGTDDHEIMGACNDEAQ